MATVKNRIPTAPIAFALFAVYCCAWLYLPPCYNEHSFVASIIDKHAALERAHSPKIVFVGGSNLALGLDSAEIEKATGQDVVNMGVSRLFGLRYCLEEIKGSINQGDTVVIVPEYENFFGEMNGSAHLMNVPLLMPRAIPWVWSAYATSPARIGALSQDALGVLTFKWNWWRSSAGTYLERCSKHVATPPDIAGSLYNPSEPPHFTRENFTRSGDFIGHLDQAPPASKYFRFCDKLSDKIDPDCVAVMNRFNEYATKRGAEVLMLPPPLPRSVYLAHKAQIEEVYGYCKNNLNFPILASPDRYVFTSKSFFNSLYHLNGPAREQRTELVLRDLVDHSMTAAGSHSGAQRM